MEDMAKIGFAADTSGLTKAKDALDDLVPAAGRAQKASEKLASGQARASAALLKEVKTISGNLTALTNSMVAGFSGVQSAMKGLGAGVDGVGAKIPPVTKKLTDLQRIGKEIGAIGMPFQQAAASVKMLDAQLASGVIANDQYAASLDRLEQAFIMSGGSAAQWAGMVNKTTNQVVAGSQKVKVAATNTQASVGNMFAQFNDIGVTAAMGMNPMIIALQQGTQVAQAFVGSGLGAAAKSIGGAFMALLSPVNLLAIGFTGLVAFGIQLVSSWFQAGEEAKTLDENMKTLSGSFDLYRQYTQVATEDTSKLIEKFGEFAGQIRGFNEYMAQVQLGVIMKNSDTVIKQMQESLAGVITNYQGVEMIKARIAAMDQENLQAIADQNDYMEIFQTAANESASALGLTVEQAVELNSTLGKINAEGSLQEMAVQAGAALEQIREIYPAGQQLPAVFIPVVSSLEEIVTKAAEAASKTTDIGTAAAEANAAVLDLANNQPGAGWLSYAIAQADLLGVKLWNASAANRSLSFGGSVGTDNVKKTTGFTGTDTFILSDGSSVSPTFPTAGKGGGGGGGGGGGASKTLTELQKIAEEFNKLSEPFDQAQSAVKAIDEALKSGIIGNDAYAQSLARIEAAFLKSGGSAEQWAKVIGKTTKSAAQQMKDLQKSSIESLGDSIADLAVDGSANFGDLAKSIIKSMIKIAIQAAIIEPLLKMFGLESGGVTTPTGTSPTALALGGAIDGGKLQPFAKGSAFTNKTFDSPTLFAFAKGGALGVMGEAGPEAVMPLARGSDGSLGVQMVGAAQQQADRGGATMVVQVINNADGTTTRQENETGADGVEYQRIIIETTQEAWARGDFDNVSKARNGATVMKTVR